jgi:hypothetical protein
MYIGIFASYVLSFVFLVFALVVLWVELSYFLFSSMTSHHEKSLTMFSIAFMVLVFVLTQTVSHSFPKLCVTLQRNFGTDAYRASCYVFRLSQSGTNHCEWRCLGFCSDDATPFAESGSGRSLWHHASHLYEARCDAETILGSPLIVGYSKVGQ